MLIKTFSHLDTFVTLLDYHVPIRFVYYPRSNHLLFGYELDFFELSLAFPLCKSALDTLIENTEWAYTIAEEGTIIWHSANTRY